MADQSEAVVAVDDSVHEVWRYLGECLLVLERIHKLSGLARPEHVLGAQAPDKLLLVLLIFIVIALGDHVHEALEAGSANHWL